jgi:hypothetical protein
MPNLSTIHLSLPEYQTDKFAEAFSEKLHLPNIRTLVLGSYNDFLIKHCPGVETVSSEGWQFAHSERGRYTEQGDYLRFGDHVRRLIVSAATAENLTYFEVHESLGERGLEGLVKTSKYIIIQKAQN